MGLAFLPGNPLDILFGGKDKIDTLVILENDLFRRASEESILQLFDRCDQIIVLDQLPNKTTLRADIVIPAATFAESEGTLVNNEGRAQRYYKTIVNKDQVKESWRWLTEFILIKKGTQTVQWKKFDDIVNSLLVDFPDLEALKNYFSDADFRMVNEKIPRQPIRYSGRTSINAKNAVSEIGIEPDIDSPLAFTMEGSKENAPASLVPFYWSPGWNSVQAVNKYLDEPNGKMKGGDSGIRLIEPKENTPVTYFQKNNQSKELQPGEWLIVPVYQIFGSDELSSSASTLAQRIPAPFVYLNLKDAIDLKVNNTDQIQLEIANTKLELVVIIENSIGQGMAGVSVNLPGMLYLDLPGTGKFHK